MQLKRYTDYSLRVLIYLGSDPDRVISINEVAGSYGISRNHLLKVVTGLQEQRLLTTYRGKSGGLKLSKSPARINIGEVIRYMEGNDFLIDCHSPQCPIEPACRLKTALHVAHRAFYQALKDYTLEMLLQGKSKRIVKLLSA